MLEPTVFVNASVCAPLDRARRKLAIVSAVFHWIVFQSVGTAAPVALALWVGIVSQFLPVVGTYLAGKRFAQSLMAQVHRLVTSTPERLSLPVRTRSQLPTTVTQP